MIRRNFSFGDGAVAWLLVSQVEHARISGELTRAWSEPFTQEAIDGITHHDDGWTAWEAAPEMDAKRGRPLSFLELDLADAIQVWDRSIDAARHYGPLAGAIVAGHFSELARGSDRASDPQVREWTAKRAAVRERWLNEWCTSSTLHTAAEAVRAQKMLYAADLFSLWLCLDGPVSAADESARPNTEMQSRSTSVLGEYHFAVQATSLTGDRLDWHGSVSPWPFAASELQLTTPARAVSARYYADWQAVATAARPLDLHWRLSKELVGG